DRLLAHAASLLDAGVPVVLAGDYNVVPTPVDIYDTHSYDHDALLAPAIRTLHPEDRIYTYWDYMRNRWPRDAGLRLDHLLLSPDLAQRLTSSGVDRAVRGEPDASDHAPAWAELREAARRSSRRPSASRAAAPRAAKGRAKARSAPRRPLLLIDGDSFAHRAY